MHFVETSLKDACLIELASKEDSRGSFCRLFCSDLFKKNGIQENQFVQVNLSKNHAQGTLRGLHYQAEPYSEAKIVYCLKGRVFDVIIDLRKDSPTYLKHFSVELAENSPLALYIPKGFAHGFLTLKEDSQLLYLMSNAYKTGFERGFRYDDPTFNIQWPFPPKILSERDQSHPFIKPTCRFCQTPLTQTFCNLGASPLSNAYLSLQQLSKQEPFYPLHTYVCANCLLVQLPTLHTPSEIFSEYAYFSSYSTSWLDHAENYARMAIERFGLTPSSQVIELASNDGYLLQYFKQSKIPVLGIEPARNVAEKAISKGIPTLTEFFGTKMASQIDLKADLLIANNVLAHVPDLNDFVAGMKEILKSHGIMTIEFPHLLKLIEENQFDTIYHEHFSYFSLHAANTIFEQHELTIFDVDQLPTHGGSLRLYVTHKGNQKNSSHVIKLLKEEEKKGLHRLETYSNFSQKVEKIKSELLDFLKNVQELQKTVVGYGAPAKGNTLLNYCGLRSRHLPYTVDRNPYKQGKFLPGTHIPIFSPDKIRETKPDFLLILPWNLKKEIIEQNSFIREWGGKFVIPIPQLEVIA